MRDEIKILYESVMTAMQPAEELGGPDLYDYVALMQLISDEAARRVTCGLRYAKADFSVLMRPPRQGERGWWVKARTPNLALAEILSESEELGWIAEKNYDGSPDENDMIAVTITVRP